ncbi:MAG: GNAT family protein [Lachnospiraceae bacterium]|nr:GNAT family protein [Lachnospiraceae bacterium]
MKIETERLILRPVSADDVDDIYEYAKGSNVGPNAGWKPHESKKETLEIAKEIFFDKENIFGMVLKESNRMIGTIGLVDDPKRENPNSKMLGYAMDETYWGKGLMTEAAKAVISYSFNEFSLKLISAYCYPFNKRSKGVIKKCGFKYEGTLSFAEKRYDGETYDIECYSIINNKV